MKTDPPQEPSPLSIDVPQSQDPTTTTLAPAGVSLAPAPVRTICFSFVLESGHIAYGLAPFPETYMAAKELALEHFGWLLKPTVTPQGIYLNRAIQIDGKKEWAFVPPPVWTQVVRGVGEELRVRYSEGMAEHFAPPVDGDTKGPPPVITFRFGERLSSQTSYKYAVRTLPDSYTEAKSVAVAALRHWMKNKNAGVDDIKMRAVVQNRDDEWVTAHLPDGEAWKETVEGLTRKYRNFEILVMEVQKGNV
ncbi:hypothetical protein NLJ89_g10860 [Agrocybe chaxingu]|uniref:Uncharacterized protein n=1 Tax=Agrocybe chaxingu TaxID=84603 RepID=A0A9W8JXD4_9AGAR|nr:hypothetical protein NLJ89_g10860 [Agrocybe chaxingu]